MRAHLIIAAVLLRVVSATAQTIPNFSFESPGFSGGDFITVSGSFITGWTIGGAGVDYFSNANLPTFATDGQYSVNYIRGSGDSSSIFTTISGLTVGVPYVVSFDLIQRDPGTGNALTATVDLTSLTFINIVSDVWETHGLDFVATGTTATLTFAGPTSGAVDSAFAHIDNVRVAVVPEPTSFSLLGIGFAFVSLTALRRRRAAPASR